MRGAIAIISAIGAFIAAAWILIYAVDIVVTHPGAMPRAGASAAGPAIDRVQWADVSLDGSVTLDRRDANRSVFAIQPAAADAPSGGARIGMRKGPG